MTTAITAPEALAYEHNAARVSRARFYAVACDPNRSVAVEACAGAGKTWMLVSRILRALLAGAQPHEILAITFTKKAAGEMRQRLHEWLAGFANATPDQLLQGLLDRGVDPAAAPALVEPLKNLYAALLASGRPVQIRTFHSWFAALLRTAPLAVLEQLGLPSSYELLEDDSEAVAQVWRRFFSAVAAHPPAREDFAQSVAMHGRFQTQKALTAALAKRVEFALADAGQVIEGSVKRFDAQFPEFAGQSLDDLLHASSAHGALLTQAAQALGRASAPTFAAKGSELEQALTAQHLQGVLDALLTQKGEPRKFSDKLGGIERVREAQALALRMAAASDQHQAWLHHQRMTRLARLLLVEFGALKRERGWVDMNDVERAALVMLSDPVLSGWVQERLDARVAHLLIDEFQDTNPLQWQALHAWLSSYAGSGSSAPSVFIVGDPKQSIYRFRRAEPQVFRAAQAFVVEGLGGDLLSCDHTHRNAPEVMDAVNSTMAAAQEAGEYEGFRHHTTQSGEAGQVVRLPQIERGAMESGDAMDEPGGWRDTLTMPREVPEEKLITLECRQAAAWIAQQLAGGLQPRELMVLARKRDRLSAMQDELRALHIPAQQPEKADLADAPEVQDLVALLDVLVSPTHDLSLARALKSPLFGLDDAALVQIALQARTARAAGAPASWFDLLQRGDGLDEPLRAIGPVLLGWKALVDQLPPHDALDAIYHQGDVLARFAAAAPAPLRASVLARLRAVLGAALQVNGARYATPYALVRALKAGGQRAPAQADVNAVRLLTVHGAKGLEAPVVLMLDTDAPAPKAETMGVLIDWPGHEAAPLRYSFIASETRPPACNAQAIEVERLARQREELNALYVAMTRARRTLVLSSVQPHAANATSWWQRLYDLSAPLAAPAPAGAASGSDTQDARFNLLALPDVTVAAPPVQPAPTPPTPESLFGQAVHRLLEHWHGDAADFAPAQLQRAAREFALDAPTLAQAAATARRILTGEGAWAWNAAAIDWHRNEVELVHQGERLRLDRLVREAASGHWWVLDYKSEWQPQRQSELLTQMARYREAVQAANPGAVVHVAFLTGQGQLIRIE